MRTLPTLVALVLLGCATQNTQSSSVPAAAPVNEEAPAEPTFIKITAPEGFSAEFPGQPQEKRGEAQSPQGPISTAVWTVTLENVIYNVSVISYPAAAAKTPESLLADAKTGLIAQLKAEVLSEEPTTLSGFAGHNFSLRADAGDVKARTFAADNRLFTMLAVYSPNLGAPPAVEKFLSSLELTPPAPPAEAAPSKGDTQP